MQVFNNVAQVLVYREPSATFAALGLFCSFFWFTDINCMILYSKLHVYTIQPCFQQQVAVLSKKEKKCW